MLVIQDAPISQISEELGFELSSFYDFFKATFGETPRQYRKKHRSKTQTSNS